MEQYPGEYAGELAEMLDGEDCGEPQDYHDHEFYLDEKADRDVADDEARIDDLWNASND